MPELTPRRERILRHVVEEYVALAQPVPSDLIARKYQGELSPATVRNEMAALEEAGLIAQPHTSAGRIPTDRGYRYFVELLMPLEDDVVLVTLLLQSGAVRQVVQRLDQVIARDELTRLSNELSDKLADK